jgi:hypothetical protein
MSLKAFHVVFITAATILCLGFGVWMLRDFRSPEGSALDLWMGVGSLVAAVSLMVYEVFFLKKLKHVSYL